MKPKMWPRWGQESFLGDIFGRVAKIGSRKLSWSNLSPRDFKMKPKMWPRWGQDAFLAKSLAYRFQDEQDEAQDVGKIVSRKLSW